MNIVQRRANAEGQQIRHSDSDVDISVPVRGK